MNTPRHFYPIILLLSIAIVMNTGCSTNTTRVTVALCVSGTLLKGGNPNEVIFQLGNLTDDYLAVLSRDTPFNVGDDGILNGEVLSIISANGESVAFRGRLVQYLGVAPEAVLQLAPREVKTVSLDIAKNYDIKSLQGIEVRLAANDLFMMRFQELSRLRRWVRRVSTADDFRLIATCPTASLKMSVR